MCLHSAYLFMLKDSKEENPSGLGLSLQAAPSWLGDVSVLIPFRLTVLYMTL